MLSTYQSQARTKLIATVVTLIVIAGVLVLTDHLKPKATSLAMSPTQSTSSGTATPQQSTTGSSTSGSSSSPNSGTYKDGTYTGSASYFVPQSREIISVNITLSNGVITNASIQNSESDPTSALYQENFAAAYKSSVVGHKISGLQLGNIAGASETTQGFIDALNQLASKAQA